MPTLDTLSTNDIINFFSKSAFSKARDLQTQAGSLVRAGNRLTAKVIDNQLQDVEISVSEQGIHAACTCNYEWDGHCKHIGAVMLRWISSPQSFRVEETGETQAVGGLEVVPAPTRPPTPPVLQPVWTTTSFAERQKIEAEKLITILGNLTVADLRGIASARGWRLSGTRKADIVAQIAEGISSIGETAKAIYSLDAEDQQVLRSYALHADSRVALGRTPEQTALAQGALTKFEKVSAYTYHLHEVGLLLDATEIVTLGSNFAGELTNSFPFSLARYFPPLLETVVPSSWQLEDAQSGHTVQMADPQAIVRAIQNLLLLIEQEPPQLRPPQPRPLIEKYQTGLQGWSYVADEIATLYASASPRNPRQQAAILTVPPPDYALSEEAAEKFLPLAQNTAHLDFLYALMVAAGLIQAGSPVRLWPSIRDPFLMRRPEQQHAVLVHTYFQMSGWTELWEAQRRSPHLRLKRRTTAYNQSPASVVRNLAEYRRVVLRLLAFLPDNRWILAEQIAPLLRAFWAWTGGQIITYYNNERTSTWFLAWDDRELDADNSQDWQRGVWAFFSAILQGPVHWLGLADLVLDGEKLHAFRLHGLTDLYWDRVESLDFAELSPPVSEVSESTPTGEEESSDALSVDKTGRIRVDTAVTTIPGHNLLRKLGRVVSSMVGLFVYKLDLDVVYATFESGLTLDDLVAEWNAALPVEMPRSVHSQLSQWWKSYGQTRIYRNATLIEFGDDYALTEMKAVTGLEKALVAELSPRLVLIDRNAVSDLVAQLEKAGYTPKVS